MKRTPSSSAFSAVSSAGVSAVASAVISSASTAGLSTMFSVMFSSGHNGLCLGVQFGRGSSILSQFFLYTVGWKRTLFGAYRVSPSRPSHTSSPGSRTSRVLHYRRILQGCSADAAGGGFAGVVLNFSAHYPNACSYSTLAHSSPCGSGVYRVGNAHMQCHVFLVVRLPAYTAVVCLLQQTQQRRWTEIVKRSPRTV